MENMKQICDGYNPKVRMGNWYEQGYSVPQPARDQPQKIPRTKEVDIGFIDNKGKLRQLNTVSRLQPWNTDNLVTNPIESHKKLKMLSTMKENYQISTVNSFQHNWKPQPYQKGNSCNPHSKSYLKLDKFNKNHKLFNARNVNQLLNQRKTDEASFKSQIKPNRHIAPNLLLETIYQQNYSRNIPQQTRTGRNPVIEKKPFLASRLDESHSAKNFRRIRSEITLKTTKNLPLTCK